jgi:hypothetical protein
MTPEEFLSRLERVRRTGPDSWIASCPAHEDKSPSLTVRAKDDGRLLVYCHAECGIEAVVGALGLEVSDLFPSRDIEYAPRERNPFPAADVLRAVADETMILAVFIYDLDFAVPLKQDDIDRARLAADRIMAARGLALGR